MKVLKRKGLLKAEETPVKKEEVKKPRKNNKVNKLPSDEYKDEFEPKELVLNESGKLVISVKRSNVDDYDPGLPKVDIRFYATTDVYTGFTKKGVNFDLEHLPLLMDILREVEELANEKGLFEEFEEE